MITPPTVQLLKHPGPVAPTRRDVMVGKNQKTYRITLRRGASLYDSVVSAMSVTGARVAALNIECAIFSHLRYFLIATSDEVEQVAHYTTPLDFDEPATLVSAGATVGTTDQGKFAIHCHGVTVTGSGRLVGGHFLTEHCILAEDGVAYLHTMDYMNLVIGMDPEIGTLVFQPSYREALI